MHPFHIFRAMASLVYPLQDIAPLGEQIARRCRAEAGKRVRANLGQMTTPEARGYIRARTGELVRDRMEHMAIPVARDETERLELVHQATDILITMVLRDWLAVRPAQASRRAA